MAHRPLQVRQTIRGGEFARLQVLEIGIRVRSGRGLAPFVGTGAERRGENLGQAGRDLILRSEQIGQWPVKIQGPEVLSAHCIDQRGAHAHLGPDGLQAALE